MKLPDWPKVETIKAFATYGIAAYVVKAVLDLLYNLVVLDPSTFGVAAIGIISILATGVTTFLFGVEVGKQQQKAFEAGVKVPTNGSTTVTNAETVTTGGPTTVEAGK